MGNKMMQINIQRSYELRESRWPCLRPTPLCHRWRRPSGERGPNWAWHWAAKRCATAWLACTRAGCSTEQWRIDSLRRDVRVRALNSD